MASATANAIPFFRLSGGSPEGASADELALMSGLLLYDSGEADETFLYRCQDRYLAYNSLCGLRTVLLVADEAHRRVYRRLIADHDRRMRIIRGETGIPLPDTPPPWFAEVDLRRPEPVKLPASYRLALNQVSPTCAHLAGEQLRPAGELALAWHDKSRYVRAAGRTPQGLPPHVPTALLSTKEFAAMRTWRGLSAAWSERTGRPEPAALYVKSSYDSGGNVAVRLCPSSFDDARRRLLVWLRRGPDLAQLRADIGISQSLAHRSFSERRVRALLRDQRRRRGSVVLLVQEAIESREDGDIQGLGVTCHVGPAGCAEIVTAAGQMYRDADRHHFCGSYLGGVPVSGSLASHVQTLCGLLAREGYHGPVNFDARRNATGEWVFLYDCNPRLSAVYPALAVRGFLSSRGCAVKTIANFGYRGEFARPDFGRTVSELNSAGLLYREDRTSGILPMPNLSREHGLDLFAVNIPFCELAAIGARCRDTCGLEFQIF